MIRPAFQVDKGKFRTNLGCLEYLFEVNNVVMVDTLQNVDFPLEKFDSRASSLRLTDGG